MSAILRQLALLMASALLFYGLAWGAVWVTLPSTGGPVIDTMESGQTFWMDSPRHVLMGRTALMNDAPKVLLLGASNTREGLRPDLIRPGLPAGVQIHNLAIGGTNFREITQVADLVDEVLPPGNQRRITYVIGLWHGLFTDDRRLWGASGETRIDAERLRNRLHERRGEAIVPAVSPSLLPFWLQAMRPYLALRPIQARLAQWRTGGGAPAGEDGEGGVRKVFVADESFRAKAMEFWVNRLANDGRLTDEQFERMVQLVNQLKARGAQVVLVDLPIPRWHKDRSPYYADYRERRRRFLDQVAGQATYLDLDRFDDEGLYRDSVHPAPAAAEILSRQLGEHLAGVAAGAASGN